MSERQILLYTAHLRGDIESLPRLHSFLRKLRADLSKRLAPDDDGDDVQVCAFQPLAAQFHLLDLGGWDAPEVWHCAATGGRSMLIGLDLLGYTAAQVGGHLSAESRARLAANHLQMQLLEGEQLLIRTDQNPTLTLPVNGEEKTATPPLFTGEVGRGLAVHLHPAAETRLVEGVLYLQAVGAGQVGMAQVVWRGDVAQLNGYEVWDVPPRTPPDATITAAVGFILAEARRKPS